MKYRLLQSLALVFISVPGWSQADHQSDADQKACSALVHSGGPVTSAERIQPPITLTETFGPKETWKDYTVTELFEQPATKYFKGFEMHRHSAGDREWVRFGYEYNGRVPTEITEASDRAKEASA